MKQDSKTKSLALAGVMTAVVMLLTLVSIPLPSSAGYINLGDAAVLMCAFLLPLQFGWAAAGLGAALSDIILGWTSYAPATFIIKGLMALFCCLLLKAFKGKLSILALLVAALMVPLGYFAYEALVLGLGTAAVANIPLNALQSAVGATLCYIVQLLMGKMKSGS